jgi:uncharacterized protein YjdB
MKPSLRVFLCLVALIPIAVSAQFSGPYAFSNWQISTIAPSGGVANGSPSFVILTGPDGNDVPNQSVTDFSIVPPATGMISFDWEYSSSDDPGYDPASYTINGEEFFLSDEPGTTGTQFVMVEAGETFGFRVRTVDGCCGSATLRISNFAAGPLVPGFTCESAIAAAEGDNTVQQVSAPYYWYTYTMSNTPGKKLRLQNSVGKEVTVFQGDCDGMAEAISGEGTVFLNDVSPGESVLIRWGLNGLSDFQWNLSEVNIEPGDNCTNPIPANLGENVLPARVGEVWYTFTMTESSLKLLSAFMDADAEVDVYFPPCEDLSQLVGYEGTFSIDNVPGVEILIVWHNSDGQAHPWTLFLDGDGSSCENARVAYEGYNYSPEAPRWFRYTMPATGDIRITSLDLYSTNPDTWLNILYNCSLAPAIFNDDHSNYQSEVSMSLQEGEQILIHWEDVYSVEQFFWQIDLSNLQQQIEFNPLEVKSESDVSFELTATASSGLPITFSSDNPAIASISGNLVTIHAVGKVNITASQAGNGDYLPAENVVQELTIKSSQSINFDEIPTKYLNSVPFALNASSTSGLPVSFVSSDPSVATVSGNTVTILSVGTTTITASQAGNEAYGAATPVNRLLTVTKVPQQISFDALAAKTINSTPFDVTASSTSGLPVSFASSNPSVATISGNTITIVSAGTTTITASQAGNATYSAAESVDRVLIVEKLSQEITFEAIPQKFVNSSAFPLSASASSGLPVSFSSSNPSVATVSGNMVTIVASGTTTITATQAGNNTYQAKSIDRLLIVNKFPQTIFFELLPAKQFTDATFTLTATTSSGLPIIFQSTNPSVATVSGNVVTIHGAGVTIIGASQPGNAMFSAAQNIERTLIINKAAQSITFNQLEDTTFPVGNIALTSISDSGLPVSYNSSDETVGTVVGQTLTIHGPGSITITALQSGNSNYEAAVPVARTFCIKPSAPQIISDFENAALPILSSSNPSGNQWFKDGVIIANATASNFVVASAGEYKVQTTVKGCTSEFSEEFNVLITSIFSEENSISVHPNPATKTVTIKGGSEDSEFKIISSSGAQVELKTSWNNQEQSMTADVSSLTSGTYYLLLRDKAGMHVIKLIKK